MIDLNNHWESVDHGNRHIIKGMSKGFKAIRMHEEQWMHHSTEVLRFPEQEAKDIKEEESHEAKIKHGTMTTSQFSSPTSLRQAKRLCIT